MALEKKITFGNILTIFALLITVITFGYNWNQDNQINRRDQANDIRDASSITLAKIERWEEISLSFYREIQPAFVEASEELEANQDPGQTRDFLWRKLNDVRNETLRRKLDEELQTAYVELFSYHPVVKSLFEDTLSRLEKSETKAFNTLLRESETDVLSYGNRNLDDFQSAELGNKLRITAAEVLAIFKQDIEDDLTCLTDFLVEIVMKDDQALLSDTTIDVDEDLCRVSAR
ncbi:MAG: hypothetical protein JSV68_03425 [Anaerolineaceae bacterium]|nr:MAG: hypothetical protein JSV68_03425 [Anaerolineaceae bacterium]